MSDLLHAPLALALAAVAVLVAVRVKPSPWMVPLARLFLPSWKFFDQPGPKLSLQIRWTGAHNRDTDWVLADPRAPTSWMSMVCSPTSARWWAHHALLDQLHDASQRVANAQELRAEVSYQLACAWARAEIGGRGHRFQFRLCAALESGPLALVTSAVHRV